MIGLQQFANRRTNLKVFHCPPPKRELTIHSLEEGARAGAKGTYTPSRRVAYMSEEDPYSNALVQLASVTDILPIEPEYYETLKSPRRR
jgi:hypothetical protein